MQFKWCLMGACALFLAGLSGPAEAEILPVEEEQTVASGTVASRLVAPVAAFSVAGDPFVAWEGFRQGLAVRQMHETAAPGQPKIRLAANDLPPRIPYQGPMTLHREPTLVALEGSGLLALWIEEVHHVDVDVFYQKSDVVRGTVVAQRLDAQGRAVGPRRILSDDDLGIAGSPRGTRLSDGRVLVVWHTGAEEGGEPGVFARLLGPRGRLGEAAFRVDSPSATPGSRPAVVAASDGGFLVAWHSCCDADGPGVFARLYDSSIEPVGEAFRVNATETGKQIRPAVTRGPGGEYLVAWMGPGEPESYLLHRVYGQVLAHDGSPLGPELAISRGGGRLHGAPALVGTREGYLAAWIVWKGDFPVAVVGAELDETGERIGDLLVLSSRPLGVQWPVALAADGEGGYLAAWEGFDSHDAPSINTRRLTTVAQPRRSAGIAPAGD